MVKRKAERTFEQHVKNLYIATYAKCDSSSGQCKKRPFNYTTVLTTYPTISKFKLEPNRLRYEEDVNENRPIDIFFGGTKRFGNPYRNFVYENMAMYTDLEFDEFNRTILHSGNYSSDRLISVLFDIGKLILTKLLKYIVSS